MNFSSYKKKWSPLKRPAVVWTSTSTVGFPLESMISRPITLVTVTTLRDVANDLRDAALMIADEMNMIPNKLCKAFGEAIVVDQLPNLECKPGLEMEMESQIPNPNL